MSTNPETSPKASPSNKTIFLARGFFLAIGIAIGLAAGYAIARFIPVSRLRSEIAEKSAANGKVAPLVEQAKLWPMTYETAEVGKPVVWCVDHPSSDVTYLNGRPDRKLLFSNEYPVPLNVGGSGGRCANVVAVVEGRKPQGLVLRFVQAL